LAIRRATAADLEPIIALGRQMHAEGYFRNVDFAEAKVRAALEHCLASGYIAVSAGADGIEGFLIGFVSELWYSSAKVASDLAFFVRPNRRGSITAVRLIQDFVAWAKEQGAAEVTIVQSSGVRLEETARLFNGMRFDYRGGVFTWRLG
jgi:GNAT superfamily N-acetyltransferase